MSLCHVQSNENDIHWILAKFYEGHKVPLTNLLVFTLQWNKDTPKLFPVESGSGGHTWDGAVLTAS